MFGSSTIFAAPNIAVLFVVLREWKREIGDVIE
jgi:hypothetical protein